MIFAKSFSFKPVTAFNCMNGTYIFTGTTTNTLRRINIFCYIHLHQTGLFTNPTMRTFIFLHLHLVDTESVKKSIYRTQRTHIFAKWPVNIHGCHQYQNQNQYFPGKKNSHHTAKSGIDRYQRYSAFKRSCRTNVLAEPWVSDSISSMQKCR